METKWFSRINVILIFSFLILGFAFSTAQCFAQEANGKKQNKPDVKIKVKKEYDDKGNITRYDSTYSYSWSGNGQIPSNIDSVFGNFNPHFEFGGDLDSMMNNFGFNWSFNGNGFFDQQLQNHNKQFEEFFKHRMPSSDSIMEQYHHNIFGNDMQKMFKLQQQIMEQFLHQFNLHSDSLLVNPIDTVPSNQLPNNKVKPQKQNYKSQNQTRKTITV